MPASKSIWYTSLACGKNHWAVKLLASDALNAHHLMALVDFQPIDAGHEMHLATTVKDGVAHVLNDARQLVAAYVGMSVDEDVLARAMLVKDAQDAVYRATLLAAGVEFAIAIGTCPTLAKAVVAVGVHLSLAGDCRHIESAVFHVLATLKHNGLHTQFDEPQRGKESSRPCSHHNGLTVAFDTLILDGWHEIVVLHGLVDIGTHLEVDHHPLLARVDRALDDAHSTQAASHDALLLGHHLLNSIDKMCSARIHSQLYLFYHSILLISRITI